MDQRVRINWVHIRMSSLERSTVDAGVYGFRVTSEFIVGGVLKALRLLGKLNLCRTAVCDRGKCYDIQ